MNTFGAGFGAGQLPSSYLSQLGQLAYSSSNVESSILQQMYSNYSSPNYNNLYGGLSSATVGSSLYNAGLGQGLLSSPPPSVSSPSPLLGYNTLGLPSRSLMGNHGGGYMSSTGGQPPNLPGSKSAYDSNFLSMYGINYPFNSTVAQPSGTTTTSTAAKSGSSLYDQNMMAFLQQHGGMYGSSSVSRTASTPSPLGQAQGPNAKKNPMLSKELSIPSLMPTRNPLADALPLPSIPTSVITKSSTSTNATGASASALNSAASTPSAANSPVDSRQSPNQAQKNDRSFPEKHIIVKNVSTINKSAQETARKSPADLQSKSATGSGISRSITNMGIVYPEKPSEDKARSTPPKTNMGIVYPPTKKDTAPSVTGVKLVPTQTLKTAQSQLQALNNKSNSPTTSLGKPATALSTVNKCKRLNSLRKKGIRPQSAEFIF